MINMRKLIAMTCIMVLLLSASAVSEAKLSAGIEGSLLTAVWSGVNGTCTLTVYRNGWPVAVRSVDGADGSARVVIEAGGAYQVRLKTRSGCLTAKADGTAAQPKPLPTQNPASNVDKGSASPAKPTDVANAEGHFRDDLAAQVASQVNAERAKRGLQPLRTDAELTRAARVRAAEIAQTFSHTRPDGTSWSTVSASAYGENIARGQKTADKVMAAWLTSEGHRANILRASYGSIGVCAYVSNGVVHWVQLFGK